MKNNKDSRKIVKKDNGEEKNDCNEDEDRSREIRKKDGI